MNKPHNHFIIRANLKDIKLYLNVNPQNQVNFEEIQRGKIIFKVIYFFRKFFLYLRLKNILRKETRSFKCPEDVR